MLVALIDYGSGNLHSAAKSFEKAARAHGGGVDIRVTGDADLAAAADAIVLPGVGAFADCMAGLAAAPGMAQALEEAVIGKGRPFLGICVGMQLMAARGFEHGKHRGLGWIEGDVCALDPSDPALKIPHMGWNTLEFPQDPHPVLSGLEAGAHAYFVHSFQMVPARAQDVLATTDYGGRLAAAIGRDNMIGVQFHPEKSQKTGLKLIANFLEWRP